MRQTNAGPPPFSSLTLGYLQVNADFSGFIVGEVNPGLFKSSLRAQEGRHDV
jgi:hypothetical protein